MVVLVIKSLLSKAQVDTAREDCQRIIDSHVLNGALDLVETACSVDPFELISICETDIARTNRDSYLNKRFTESHKSLLRNEWADIVLNIIPSFISKALQISSPLYLFLENYIIKPEHSDLEFRWHRDGDEQLACLEESARPEYWACWCPLDDANKSNGTIIVSPVADVKHCSPSDPCMPLLISEPTKFIDNAAGQLIEVAAGDAIVFSSLEWHCSGPNASGRPRRVLYAQYSVAPIIGRTIGEATPMSFAVRCGTI